MVNTSDILMDWWWLRWSEGNNSHAFQPHTMPFGECLHHHRRECTLSRQHVKYWWKGRQMTPSSCGKTSHARFAQGNVAIQDDPFIRYSCDQTGGVCVESMPCCMDITVACVPLISLWQEVLWIPILGKVSELIKKVTCSTFNSDPSCCYPNVTYNR